MEHITNAPFCLELTGFETLRLNCLCCIMNHDYNKIRQSSKNPLINYDKFLMFPSRRGVINILVSFKSLTNLLGPPPCVLPHVYIDVICRAN